MILSGGRSFPLRGAQSWAVGRGAGCAVALDSRSVSRLHALLQLREDGAMSLIDLGSRNGSFVNNRRITVPVVLNDGDSVVFGDLELLFRDPRAGKGKAELGQSRVRATLPRSRCALKHWRLSW